MNPFYYALIAGVFAGIFQIARKIISTQGLTPLLGATIFSLVAGLLGVVLLIKQKFSLASISGKSLILAASAGLLVLPIDYCILKAYEKGFPIALGSLILVAISAGIAVLFGMFFLHEPVKPIKFFAIILIFAGILIIKAVK